MKVKECAIIGFFHFFCTFILGVIIYLFSPKTMPLDFNFWLSLGVGVGRFCIELFKAYKVNDKIIGYFKSLKFK